MVNEEDSLRIGMDEWMNDRSFWNETRRSEVKRSEAASAEFELEYVCSFRLQRYRELVFT